MSQLHRVARPRLTWPGRCWARLRRVLPGYETVNPAVHVCHGPSSVTPDIGPYLEDLGSSDPYDCVPTHPYVRNGTSLAAGEISNSLSETDYDTDLYRALGGENQLPVQATGAPTVSLPDGSAVPALETVGAFHGDRVTLVVVNQPDTDDIPAEVSAAGAPVGSGTVTTLDGDSPLASNSPAEPNAVTLHTAGPQAADGAVPVTFPAHSISLLQLSAAPAPSAGA